MALLDTLSNHIPDSVLDQVYELSQRRVKEIDESGYRITTWPTGTIIKSVRTATTFRVHQGAPVNLGTILRDGTEFNGAYLVTEIIDKAGCIELETTHLTESCDVCQVSGYTVDLLGRGQLKTKPTNWTHLPSSKVINNKVVLPLGYQPDPGDALLIGGDYWYVTNATSNSILVECTVKEF